MFISFSTYYLDIFFSWYYNFIFYLFRSEVPLQSYKDESIDSTIESPDVIPSDSQGTGTFHY